MSEIVNNISNSNLILFWIIVFSFFFLLFLTILLFLKNKELSKLLKQELLAKNKLEVNKQLSFNQPSNEISQVEMEATLVTEPVPTINDVLESSQESKVIENGPYSKNILKDISSSSQTSPIRITDKVNNETLKELQEDLNDNVDSIDIIHLDVNNQTSNNSYEEEYYDSLNDGNISFVEEISKKMEKEIEPKTIELTDYEQQQEEEAIISYQELMKEKDNFVNVDDENPDSDDDFINELKQFRQSL